MSDERHPEDGPEEQGSIFGKLPSARPGVRSPRRAAGKRASEAKRASEPPATPAKPRADAPSTASRRPPPPPPPPRSDEPEPDAPARGHGAGGVEDVAWAGITVAAEAATLGVRLLSRAVEAVRKPGERR
jgi:hypothetical protein